MSTAVIAPIGAALEIKQDSPGQYTVTQLPAEEPNFALHSEDRKTIELDIKFIKIQGYYDPNTREIGIVPYFFGARIGSGYYAGLDTGIGIDINYALYSGRISVGPDSGKNNLQIGIHIDGIWGLPSVHEDIKLFAI